MSTYLPLNITLFVSKIFSQTLFFVPRGACVTSFYSIYPLFLVMLVLSLDFAKGYTIVDRFEASIFISVVLSLVDQVDKLKWSHGF